MAIRGISPSRSRFLEPLGSDRFEEDADEGRSPVAQEAKAVVEATVVQVRHQHEVAAPVVAWVPVQMVDVLLGQQRPAQHVLHDDAMLGLPVAALAEPVGDRVYSTMAPTERTW
jgi:hypothetical protein